MIRILHVALRDFIATAATKAFVIGAFVVPLVLVLVMAVGFKFLLNEDTPEVRGTLAVIDPTGAVTDEIAERIRPEAIAERRGDNLQQIREATAGLPVGDDVGEVLEQQFDLGTTRITVESLDPSTDVEQAKQPLRDEGAERLALAVIDPDALQRSAGSEKYGTYELYVRAGLDDRIQDEIRSAVRLAVRYERILAASYDPGDIEALIDVDAPRTKEVTAEGERTTLGELRTLIPFGFMIVLMISVMVGAQYLLTTTVEEKSSRVVEVLLSALTPMQLMSGKILGQLGVSLVILAIYASIGGGALIAASLGALLGPLILVYMLIFFLMTYAMVGAAMAAVGSAVNDIREAQALQTPVMMTMIIPYMLWFPISRDPNSWFATICSMLPPVNGFVMMLRVTSTEPPPTWQVLLSIGIGLVGVWVAIWAAAKIFRIGVLMYGKPPNFATLLRWIRLA